MIDLQSAHARARHPGAAEVRRSWRLAARRTGSCSLPDRERSRGGRRSSRSRSVRARCAGHEAPEERVEPSDGEGDPARARPRRVRLDEEPGALVDLPEHSSPTRLSGGRPKNRVYQSMLASRSVTGTPAKRWVIALMGLRPARGLHWKSVRVHCLGCSLLRVRRARPGFRRQRWRTFAS
jgi:hypothetical protein